MYFSCTDNYHCKTVKVIYGYILKFNVFFLFQMYLAVIEM